MCYFKRVGALRAVYLDKDGMYGAKGKLLRLELQFKNDPMIDLKRADKSSVATLRRGYS